MLDFMAESVGIAKNHSSTLKKGYLIFPGFGLLCEEGCHIIQHKKITRLFEGTLARIALTDFVA
ncbi:hypothetical protein [Chlorobium phaeovibrioides]|uniref:hypothetical protein n=1 Tax=Chlorobium phaeovibrioides TaxID=1094 RepID=UPI001CE3EFD8|nr:hypothetical protein [Chlorobium phaeovibrioides]